MAIYQGDIGIHDIKLGSIDVFEIYQGSKLVYPENTEITITFKLNVSGSVTINGYTPVISENNTKFVFTIPVKTDYTSIVTAEHYKSQTISGNSGYLPITHNVELEWEQEFISYTVTFPTDGVKVLFDGIEKGVITNGKLVVLIDDTEAKDSYTVTFKGSKASIYDTSTLTVVDSSIANTGGSYDLKLPTSSVKSGYKRTDYASSAGSITKGSTYAGTWIETVVNLTANFTSSTTLGSISNNVLTILNNESTNAKSGTLTVIFTLENKQTKEVSAALNQAAGAKSYGAKVYHTAVYNRDSSNYTDYTGYPVTHDVGGEPTIAAGDSIVTFCRLSITQAWTWNGVIGSGGTDTTYMSAKDVSIVSQSNCTPTVKDVSNGNFIIFTSVVPANPNDTSRIWSYTWRWYNDWNITIRDTQAANPVRGRLAIKNDYFTSQNVALPIYLDSENVDSIYKGEASYNDIKKTPISVYVYIPTNIAIMNAGKLQFWFEDKNGSNKYTCTLSNVSTPSNSVSVSNSNNIISVTANTTTSSFTILCQFTMTSNSTVFNVRVLIEP